MIMKKIFKIIIACLAACVLLGFLPPVSSSTTSSPKQQIVKLEYQIKKARKKIAVKNRQIKHWRKKLAKEKQSTATSQTSASQITVIKQQLANLNYNKQAEITVNHNNPEFLAADLITAKGAWQLYGNLDDLNRPTVANALLNQSLMPTAKREELTWDPTGWHNKRISSGWLYNRSHLIGYQLTGQNNNPKNLITGTRKLNAPEMLAHEDDIADYLKQSSQHYVRYRVTPIFRGQELLARGVQMEAQSIGSDAIHFNVYIFNVEPGVTLNYTDGTSQIN
mgnify:CR=1 FL=1